MDAICSSSDSVDLHGKVFSKVVLLSFTKYNNHHTVVATKEKDNIYSEVAEHTNQFEHLYGCLRVRVFR